MRPKLKTTLDHYKGVGIKDKGLSSVTVGHFGMYVAHYKVLPNHVFINGFNNIAGQRYIKLCIGGSN